jgi:hypothetical protein
LFASMTTKISNHWFIKTEMFHSHLE